MREFTLVQDIRGTVDEHWTAFFDPTFEREIVKALKFRSYDILAHDETEATITHKTRAVPHLDASAALATVFGARFGYVEDGTFDKATRIWRARTTPDTFSGKMSCDMVMRVEPAAGTSDRSQRTLDFKIEARVRAIGGLVEAGFEKNLRAGWKDSVEFLNGWLTRSRAQP